MATGLSGAASPLTLAILAGVIASGCERRESTAREQTLPEARDVYQDVRGEIVSLPDLGPPPRDLVIRHEHIPDFKGADGTARVNEVTIDGNTFEVPGMRAMTMPFPRTAPDVDVDALAVGDKVTFDLHVAYDGSIPTYWISDIRDLPDDAVISMDDKTRTPASINSGDPPDLEETEP